MENKLARIVCAITLGIAIGMCVQTAVDLLRSGSANLAAELTRTTAERDRLLEHLADVESGSATDACMPVMGWICPDKGGR